MEISSDFTDRAGAIEALFRETFTDSDGVEAGRLVGELARDLLAGTKPEDIFAFSSGKGDEVIGCIVFTRLGFEEDDRTVFLLSPVAVATRHQGRGIGQRLLRHGLDALRKTGVDVAITYGSPKYYARVGFTPITEDIAQPPLPLSHPHGWLAQSLTGRPLDPLKGPSRCVAPLDNPAHW